MSAPLAELSAPTRLQWYHLCSPFFLGGAHSQLVAAVYHTAHQHQVADKSLEAAWPHPRLSLDSETKSGEHGLGRGLGMKQSLTSDSDLGGPQGDGSEAR